MKQFQGHTTSGSANAAGKALLLHTQSKPLDNRNFELESVLSIALATPGDSKLPGTSHTRHFLDIMEDRYLYPSPTQHRLDSDLALTLLSMYCLEERVSESVLTPILMVGARLLKYHHGFDLQRSPQA
jgi:hypothetical protein